ncbi:peptide synthetase [Streptacidiphilus pinicola]|uniref:Peptide synthetase n=1 Tax=Streptacidiphilus pinicola TaxID=2219663 RepID=A0A2X0KCW4_9ACTN|nr:SDR family NAD(P)-dependent oxidoreductase [Streptacidiphilus pinicola]RAG85059.1 peptide synthetase [Streptacidiphilus pinicola]
MSASTNTSGTFADDELAALADAVRAVPGVHEVAAVTRLSVRAQPAAAAGRADIAPTPTAPTPADHGDRPPAELYGGDVTPAPGAPATLQEALRLAAELAPDKGTIFITEDHDDDLQTYPQLLAEAEQVLGGLRADGCRPGDAVLFVFDDNRGYLTAFWACVLGGFIPTPVAVATSYTVENEPNRKLLGAWKLLGRPRIVTDAGTAPALTGVRELWNEPEVRILTVEELAGHPADRNWYPASPQSPVLNLLTSGSTGVPKCVQHTHASVTSREHAVIRHCGLTADDVTLMWMPFDHVTIAFCNVRDVFLGCLHVNARTSHALSDPLLWLDWADRHRATNIWVPNFAIGLVNERAEEIADRDWDLSCLREIVNAGEPVIAATSHRFLELLAPHRLPADAMVPVWGMSETCSGVTYSRQSRTDRLAGTVTVDPSSLSHAIRFLDPADDGAVTLSRVGRPIPGVRLRIVDETGAVLPEDRLGELRITGSTMMAGYFGNEQANRESYDDQGWFRTGDLAFAHEGEIVIAGRKKDQIIVRGINYLAHELESVVERVDGVQVTFAAVAGIREPGAEEDQLVVFYVPRSWDAAAQAQTAEDIRAVLGREAGIVPAEIIPVSQEEFPKTSSGKIQRPALAQAFRQGAFADRTLGTGPTQTEDDSWLFTRRWLEADPGPKDRQSPEGLTLVLAEDEDLARLGLDGNVVAARRGDTFAQTAPGRYQVPAADREALGRLLAAVAERHGPITRVLSALQLSRGDADPFARLTTATAELAALLAALAASKAGEAQLVVLTAGALPVRPDDDVDLGSCAMPGLVRTAADEFAPRPLCQVDLPGRPDQWGPAVRSALAAGTRGPIIAVRDGRLWQPRLAPVTAPEAAGATGTTAPLLQGGLYLLSGGLGGIAHDIAGYLLATFGVKLLLVGRSPAEGEKAARLAGLTRLGEVCYAQLDITDADALQAATEAAEQRWGRPLDGVLHLAAADPTGQWADLDRHTVVHETADGYAAQYRAKVGGTLALAGLLQTRPAASLVLFGSVNGEFGGHSFGAYAAANSFLAGFAEHWHRTGRRGQCIAWSQWSGVGMNQGRSSAAAEHRGFRTIDPDTGLRLFLDALALEQPYVIAGLDAANPAIVAELVPEQLRVTEAVLAYTASDIPVDPQAVRAAVARQVAGFPVPVRITEVAHIPRNPDGGIDAPQLLKDTAPGAASRHYNPPQGEAESRLAPLWAEALRRHRVGRDESFFELGGNSLRAARVLALTQQTFGVRVTTQELYEHPTVAGLAALIEKRQIEKHHDG